MHKKERNNLWRITVGNIQKNLDDEQQGVVYFSHKKVFIFFLDRHENLFTKKGFAKTGHFCENHG